MQQRYEILDLIATGGMAEIYRGRAFGAGGFEKPIVVKKILPSLVRDREFVEMFIEEAKLAATLHHGNIVQVYDLGSGDEEDEYFIIMEYVNGRDLGDVIHYASVRGVEIGFKESVYIVKQVCAGLDYAHRKLGPDGKPLGIIHRDVSPQNVLLSFEGEVKLTDFGIAKAKTRAQRTQVGFLKGKYGYMSPEQSRGERLDHRSDIFNVGIMLYELLVGERLFVGSSDFSTLNLMRNAVVTPPRKLKGDIPEGLEAIVMKALALKPEDRFQTAQEMEKALTRFSFEQSLVASAGDIARLMERIFGKPRSEVPQPKGTRVIALGSVDGRGKQAKRSSPPPEAAGEASADRPKEKAPRKAASDAKPKTVPLGPSKKAPSKKSSGKSAPNRSASKKDAPKSKAGRKPASGPNSGPRPTTLDLRRKAKSRHEGTGKVAASRRPAPRGMPSLLVLAIYLVAFAVPGGLLFLLLGPRGEAPAAVLRRLEAERLSLRESTKAGQSLSAPEAVVVVHSEPEGARIFLDGTPAEGRTPAVVPLAAEPRSHALELRKEGFEPWKGKAILPEGHRAVVVSAKLVPERQTLRVRSQPRGATVTLDGEVVGKTPLTVPRVANGPHEIEVTAPGHLPWKGVYEMKPGRRTLEVRLPKKDEAVELAVVTWPAARVTVAGRSLESGTGSIFVPPGRHVLRFERPGAPPLERPIRLEPGRRLKLFFDLTNPGGAAP